MEPRDYGPFPYVPIRHRPKLVWPGEAQLAVWIIPNIEFFSLKDALSGHPFESYAAELAPLVRQSLAGLSPRRETVMIAGIVTALRVQSSRRGKMAFVTLDDGRGTAEIVVFNETFDAARNLLRDDQLVIVEAKIQQRVTDDGQMQGLRVIAEAVHDLPAIRKRHAKALRLACNGGADAARLATLLGPFRNGSCGIVVEYRNSGVGGEIELPESWRVNPDEALLAQLRDWLAPENVRVVY